MNTQTRSLNTINALIDLEMLGEALAVARPLAIAEIRDLMVVADRASANLLAATDAPIEAHRALLRYSKAISIRARDLATLLAA